MAASIAVSEKIVPRPHSPGNETQGPMRVLIFDLLPTVPYYTGYLSAALKRMKNIEVVLASATYTHDRTCFERMRLQNAPGIFDFAYRSRTTSIRRVLKFIEYLLNMARFAANFGEKKPDVIHVQFTPLMERNLPFELWFLKAARARGTKLVYTVHNILPHEDSEQLRSSYCELYGIIDQLICHDAITKRRMVSEFCVDPDRVSVIPHGPLFAEAARTRATCNYEQARAMTGLPPGARVVLWQGIIRPYKGIPLLLRAWQAARQEGMDAVLAIVGTGEKSVLRELQQQVRLLGIASSVHLDLRFVSVAELGAYHEAADILVYPYSAITTSGALATGVGYEKAIIASALPAFQQMLEHEKNALMVPHDDVRGWANALLRLTSDDDLRTRLARQLTADYAAGPDWDGIASETLSVYRRPLLPALRLSASTS
jgi:glycosyltransferase involved in cell wall biosynthesis